MRLSVFGFIVCGLAAVVARTVPPDVVASADGTGKYTSLQTAIDKAPMRTGSSVRRRVIFVKPGVYHERIHVQRERGNILVQGADATTTIAFDLNANQPDPANPSKTIGTFHTPTVQIDGDQVILENLTIANTAGPVGQALARRADGDRLTFRRCRFLGWQDTVLVNSGRDLFDRCRIEGHVDFIFGAATAFLDHCEIHVLRSGYITTASTPEGQAHGFVFADCRITADPGPDIKTYLGLPWRPFAQTVFLRPEGWHNWGKPEAEQTSFYAEYASTGPGAAPAVRVPWARALTDAAAAALTRERVLGWR